MMSRRQGHDSHIAAAQHCSDRPKLIWKVHPPAVSRNHRCLLLALGFAMTCTWAMPARSEWLIAESAHFRVHADMPEAAIRQRTILLEDYRNLLILMTKGPTSEALEPKLDVFIVKDMAQVFPFSRAPSGVAGLYSANAGGIAAYADTSELGQAALQHEYTHHFMRANRSAAYPAWFSEGFAEYFMTATFKSEAIEYGRFREGRATWLASNEWLPLEAMLKRDIYGRGGERVMMFYAQSWLMTHYFLGAPGQAPKLRAYLTAVAAGEDPEKAFAIHVTPDFSGFQSSLKAYLRSKDFVAVTLKRPPASPAPVTVRPAPPGASTFQLLLNRMMMATDVSSEARGVAVRRAIARDADSPLSARARALLALQNKDPEAISLLDRMLAAEPQDPELLLWRGMAALTSTTQNRLEARRYLTRAFKANPDDWRVMRMYALASGLRDAPLNENDFGVIRRAYELAPQVSEVTIDYATALVHRDDLNTAAKLLSTLANNPHDNKSALLAASLREAAIVGDKQKYLSIVRSYYMKNAL